MQRISIALSALISRANNNYRLLKAASKVTKTERPDHETPSVVSSRPSGLPQRKSD